MDPTILEDIAGDLEEERRRRAATGSTAARVWFWRTWLGIRLYIAWQGITAAIGGARGPRLHSEWRTTLRALGAAPVYTLACIAVIALSTGLSTTVFAVVDGVLFTSLPFDRPDQLVVIRPGHRERAGREGAMAASGNDISMWRAALPDVPIGAAQMPFGGPSGRMPLGPEVNAVQVETANVDAEFLHVLGVQPILGGFPESAFRVTSRDTPRSALLSYALWQTAFSGDPRVVGRIVTVTEQPRVAFEIDGVLPESFVVPSRVDAGMLLAATPLVQPGGLARRFFPQVFARLPPDQSAAVVRQRIEAAMAAAPVLSDPAMAAFAAMPAGRQQLAPYNTVTLVPVRAFLTEWQGQIALAVFVTALLLLALGGVNVSGLVAARGQRRARAVAIRRALGAGAWAIIRFVFAEVAVLVIAGTAAGFALARPMLSVTVALLPANFHPMKPITIDWRVAAFAALCALVGAVLVTVAPARRALRRPVVMQGEAVTATRRLSRGSRVNVATQVAIATTLAVGGSLLVGSLVSLWQAPLGFDRSATAVSLRLRRAPQAGGMDDVAAMLDRVRRVPGVEAAGVMDAMLLQQAMQGGAVDAPPGRPKNDMVDVPVTPGFFDVTRPALLAGRYPTAAELEAGTALVVSDSVAREFWPGAPAVGRTLTANGATLTVVGVAEEARYMSWDYSMGVIYEPYATLGSTRSPNLLVRGRHGSNPPIGDILAAIGSAGSWMTAARVDPLDDLLAATIRDRRFDAWFFGTFAAGGLAIVLTGLFGLVAMTAAERTREVGVRMALGATRERVVGLLVGETASAVAAGLAAGGLVAAWAVRYLKSSMYEMGVYDLRLWILAAVALLIAAGVGAFIPATRASRIDAVKALRED